MSKLYYIYGPMHSGKTRDILRVAYNYEEVGHRTILIKPLIDTKGNDMIRSATGEQRKADYVVDDNENLYYLIENELKNGKIGVVIIDESQFLTPLQVEQLVFVVTYLNITVRCYGLRTDFLGNLFPGSAALFAHAHILEESKTMCADGCLSEAVYNERYVDGEVVLDGEQVCIDDQKDVEYKSVCAGCSKVRGRKKEFL